MPEEQKARSSGALSAQELQCFPNARTRARVLPLAPSLAGRLKDREFQGNNSGKGRFESVKTFPANGIACDDDCERPGKGMQRTRLGMRILRALPVTSVTSNRTYRARASQGWSKATVKWTRLKGPLRLYCKGVAQLHS